MKCVLVSSVVLLLLGVHTAQAQQTTPCRVLCTPEFKVEPTITFTNLFGSPRTIADDGAPTREPRETEFELILSLGLPTRLSWLDFTVEAIFLPTREPRETESCRRRSHHTCARRHRRCRLVAFQEHTDKSVEKVEVLGSRRQCEGVDGHTVLAEANFHVAASQKCRQLSAAMPEIQDDGQRRVLLSMGDQEVQQEALPASRGSEHEGARWDGEHASPGHQGDPERATCGGIAQRGCARVAAHFLFTFGDAGCTGSRDSGTGWTRGSLDDATLHALESRGNGRRDPVARRTTSGLETVEKLGDILDTGGAGR